MKRICFCLLLLAACGTAVAQVKAKNSFYKLLPSKPAAVNDFAAMLTAVQKKALEVKLVNFNNTTGNALVIITHTSLTDKATRRVYTVEEAAAQYFKNWGIGNSKKNNGVLIFVAKNDRKVRIATGKGIMTALTNEDCQAIIDNDIVPAFKAGDYYRGLDDASTSIMKELLPEEKSTTETTAAQNPGNDTGSFIAYSSNGGRASGKLTGFLCAGAGFLILLAVISRATRQRQYRSAPFSSSWQHSYNYGQQNQYAQNNAGATELLYAAGSFPSDTCSSSADFSSPPDSSSSGSSSSDSGISGSDSGTGSSDGGGASGSW